MQGNNNIDLKNNDNLTIAFKELDTLIKQCNAYESEQISEQKHDQNRGRIESIIELKKFLSNLNEKINDKKQNQEEIYQSFIQVLNTLEDILKYNQLKWYFGTIIGDRYNALLYHINKEMIDICKKLLDHLSINKHPDMVKKISHYMLLVIFDHSIKFRKNDSYKARKNPDWIKMNSIPEEITSSSVSKILNMYINDKNSVNSFGKGNLSSISKQKIIDPASKKTYYMKEYIAREIIESCFESLDKINKNKLIPIKNLSEMNESIINYDGKILHFVKWMQDFLKKEKIIQTVLESEMVSKESTNQNTILGGIGQGIASHIPIVGNALSSAIKSGVQYLNQEEIKEIAQFYNSISNEDMKKTYKNIINNLVHKLLPILISTDFETIKLLCQYISNEINSFLRDKNSNISNLNETEIEKLTDQLLQPKKIDENQPITKLLSQSRKAMIDNENKILTNSAPPYSIYLMKLDENSKPNSETFQNQLKLKNGFYPIIFQKNETYYLFFKDKKESIIISKDHKTYDCLNSLFSLNKKIGTFDLNKKNQGITHGHFINSHQMDELFKIDKTNLHSNYIGTEGNIFDYIYNNYKDHVVNYQFTQVDKFPLNEEAEFGAIYILNENKIQENINEDNDTITLHLMFRKNEGEERLVKISIKKEELGEEKSIIKNDHLKHKILSELKRKQLIFDFEENNVILIHKPINEKTFKYEIPLDDRDKKYILNSDKPFKESENKNNISESLNLDDIDMPNIPTTNEKHEINNDENKQNTDELLQNIFERVSSLKKNSFFSENYSQNNKGAHKNNNKNNEKIEEEEEEEEEEHIQIKIENKK